MSERAYVYGHNERVGLRKLNVTDPRFRFFAWECVGTDSVKLTGCVVTRTITRGPRKGQPAYDKPHVVAVVTEAERTQERERWEADNAEAIEKHQAETAAALLLQGAERIARATVRIEQAGQVIATRITAEQVVQLADRIGDPQITLILGAIQKASENAPEVSPSFLSQHSGSDRG